MKQSKHTPATPGAPAPRPTLTLKWRPTPESATRARVPAGRPATRFWINWRTDGFRPKHRHATLESALAEKERLAAMFPSATFQTFECRIVQEGTP